MEAYVWSDTAILRLLKNEFVISTLYVDDQSALSINKDDSIKSYGKKQLYIEQTKFKIKIYPSYFIVNGKEILLAGPYYFNLTIDSFINFLQEGIKKYKNDQTN